MAIEEQTLEERNRREPDIIKHYVRDVLPSYFAQEYPKLVALLETYYEFEDQNASSTDKIHSFYELRDITRVSEDLLIYIEDELLLGQSYFEGFDNKRDAAKFSTLLYRSKGTKYGIEQFFRQFFSIDPDIIYGRNFVFNLNDDKSTIGPQSQRLLTNDKFIQQLAIRIKTELATSKWLDVYKLFTHPAGVFIDGQTQIVSQAGIALTADTEEGLDQDFFIVSTGELAPLSPNTSLTGIVGVDSVEDVEKTRIDLTRNFKTLDSAVDFLDITIEQFDSSYSTLETFGAATSITFDDSANAAFGSTIETMDRDRFLWWSADSDYYTNQIDSDGANNKRFLPVR